MDKDVLLDFQLLDTEMEPKVITKTLGVIPDDEMAKGGRNSKIVLPRVNIWSIRSKSDSDEIKDHWEDMSSVILPREQEIKSIAMKGRAVLTIVINSENRIPSIIIPNEMLRFLGNIGAIIDIDHMQ